MSLTHRLHRIVGSTVDARSLAIVRIAVGFALLIRGFVSWDMMNRVYLSGLCVLPYFDWLPVLPHSMIPGFCLFWSFAGFCLMIGWRTTIAGVSLLILISYFLALDQQFYGSHLYLMALICFLVTIGDSTADLACKNRTNGVRTRIQSWPVTLLKLQLSIVYLFTSFTKINHDYLSGLVINLNLRGTGSLGFPENWLTPSLASLMAVGSIATELFLAIGLWFAATRRLAVTIGIVFHGSILIWIAPAVFWELIVFAVETLCLYSLFFWKIEYTPAWQRPDVSERDSAERVILESAIRTDESVLEELPTSRVMTQEPEH
ncbi:MAG TPA: HTTM domain-containing protein [Planctomycetaceae bacterium]|nr:HTTM domain-containing protein [Planctomycetaceae bacterium]